MKFKLSKDPPLCNFPSCCSNLITCPGSPWKMLVHIWAGDLSRLIFIWKKQKTESSGTAVIHCTHHIKSSFAESHLGGLSLPRWAGGPGCSRGPHKRRHWGSLCILVESPLPTARQGPALGNPPVLGSKCWWCPWMRSGKGLLPQYPSPSGLAGHHLGSPLTENTLTALFSTTYKTLMCHNFSPSRT